jgi:hypothetical protein
MSIRQQLEEERAHHNSMDDVHRDRPFPLGAADALWSSGSLPSTTSSRA